MRIRVKLKMCWGLRIYRGKNMVETRGLFGCFIRKMTCECGGGTSEFVDCYGQSVLLCRLNPFPRFGCSFFIKRCLHAMRKHELMHCEPPVFTYKHFCFITRRTTNELSSFENNKKERKKKLNLSKCIHYCFFFHQIFNSNAT